MYRLHFENIKRRSKDKYFTMSDLRNKKEEIVYNIFEGIYYDEIPKDSMFHMLNDDGYKFPPIKYIDESIDEHYTQIIYLLKELFTDSNEGFTGWKKFTKEQIMKALEHDKYIYIENYSNGQEFVNKFPIEIDRFLKYYCIKED